MTSVQMETTALSVAMLPSSQTADPKNQSNPHHEKVITESKPPSLESLPTEATDCNNEVYVRDPYALNLNSVLHSANPSSHEHQHTPDVSSFDNHRSRDLSSLQPCVIHSSSDG